MIRLSVYCLQALLLLNTCIGAAFAEESDADAKRQGTGPSSPSAEQAGKTDSQSSIPASNQSGSDSKKASASPDQVGLQPAVDLSNQAGSKPGAPPAEQTNPLESSLRDSESIEKVQAGAFALERSELRKRIQEAKEKGVGIQNYLRAFQSIENAVANGDTSPSLQARVLSLSRSLDDQLTHQQELRNKPAGTGATGGFKGTILTNPAGVPTNILAPGQRVPAKFLHFGSPQPPGAEEAVSTMYKQFKKKLPEAGQVQKKTPPAPILGD